MFSHGGKIAALFFGAFLLVTANASAAHADGITLTRNSFLKDGHPWAPKGFILTGFVAPDKELGPAFQRAHDMFGPQEFSEMRAYGADTVRIHVSQAGLDPQSSIYDPKYLPEVIKAIQEVRDAGFVVIISMQWEKPAGLPDLPKIPTDSTLRAWQKLIPAFADDGYVMLEPFNEPGFYGPDAWTGWQKWMQAIVDEMRGEGAQNVIVLDGIQWSHILAGAPQLSDPLNKLSYTIHPFIVEHLGQGPENWDAQWGDFAKTHPVFAGAWNELPAPGYCMPAIPMISHELIEYLGQRRMGLLFWAYDLTGTFANKQGYPLIFTNFECGVEGSGGAASLSVNYMRALAALEKGTLPISPPEPIVPPVLPVTPPPLIPIPVPPVPTQW